jgi:hypothetical protein
MPTIIPPSILSFTSIDSFRLERYAAVVRSRFTGQTQRIIYPMAVWVFEAKLKDYVEPDATTIRGFLANLQGQVNPFRLVIPGKATPSTGVTDLNIQTNVAAAARATSVALKQLNVSATILKAGDYFTIGEELKIATADLISNSSGIGTINFTPPLRSAYPISTPVKINDPTVLLYASDDDVLDQAIGPPVISGFTLKAIEAIDV